MKYSILFLALTFQISIETVECERFHFPLSLILRRTDTQTSRQCYLNSWDGGDSTEGGFCGDLSTSIQGGSCCLALTLG